MTDLILDARDIHAWYGSSHILHGVGLQVARGETVGLLGRNGMGKSTLIRTLSGGEQQMLSIGRALMTQPELVILDEATEGLAPLIVAEIWRVIGEIRNDGIATLIVDRDFRRVLSHSDRAVVLQKGQVVMAGRSAELRGSAELANYLGV
jgi:ABC-type branched-subunit amino acid transport system ATPase component